MGFVSFSVPVRFSLEAIFTIYGNYLFERASTIAVARFSLRHYTVTGISVLALGFRDQK
jgi:hypothetical protein